MPTVTGTISVEGRQVLASPTTMPTVARLTLTSSRPLLPNVKYGTIALAINYDANGPYVAGKTDLYYDGVVVLQDVATTAGVIVAYWRKSAVGKAWRLVY